MKTVVDILEEKISTAMVAVSGQEGCAALVRPATDPKFGDYQVNGIMPLAKQIKTNPCKLAEQVVKNLDVSDICEPSEIAGPGFINLRLKPDFVADRLLEISKDQANLGVESAKGGEQKTIVVDFSSPNIAKQMHVGHLRSTIIGDCICRLLEFLGHKVIRQNHIGDWGTQFGMLIAYHRRQIGNVADYATGRISSISHIRDLEGFYKKASELYGSDTSFAEEARQCVVKLQIGNPTMRSSWERIVEWSRNDIYPIYEKLNVTLEREDERGESFYKDMLSRVVGELKRKNLAVESEGAVCVFPPGFKDKEGKALPVIIQKSDGAYLYATTDLAAIRYRVNELKADRIVYVTDARQSLHFQMLFAVADMAGWATRQKSEDRSQKTELIHVTFGSVLGENGKPLKTRSGENVKLKELLDEAVEQASKIVNAKNPELSDKQKEKIAKAVGIGAVKYADYSNSRTSDYVFRFDKMLAMDGNTAPYMQYAYARIKSIGRKARERGIDVERELAGMKVVSLTEPSELNLGKHLIRYGEAIQAAIADYRPNYLTAYLYELAQKFSAFYTECPVLDAGPDKRPTRLLLCDLTARTIEPGRLNRQSIGYNQRRCDSLLSAYDGGDYDKRKRRPICAV
ncbi:MAG: arginine--tRNA ligase [Planctomycetota bacterium]|nr:arginine--tRNA ligase [Planctomycetota bacterium]